MLVDLLNSFLLFFLPLLFIFFYTSYINNSRINDSKISTTSSISINKIKHPKNFPIIGSAFAIYANRNRRIQWTAELVKSSPTATYVLHLPFGSRRIFTGNPANVEHILKSNFQNYEKGDVAKTIMKDMLGNGIFNVDAEPWKFQRKISSHEFNTKSLRKFVETVVDTELNDRLIPILSDAAKNRTILDIQDILQRFAFDNICKIAFGYDPAYLWPSLPQAKFAQAFDEAARITTVRFNTNLPAVWKLKRLLGIGSEKRLQVAVSEVREFARKVVREKKEEIMKKSTEIESLDLLSRFLSSGHSDEDFVIDIVISFILAGRDTTSAALTWYFWLLHKNPHVEERVLEEIRQKLERPVAAYDEVKDMVYTHASLCESMRLYPPVPVDGKEAIHDDVLVDKTVVKKGMRITYHPFAMGRLEELWGSDWEEFKPERWLEEDGSGGKWSFVGRDSFVYPVFQAGPRVCLGKEMAFLQMKRVVAGVLKLFKVVSAVEEGVEPVYVSYLTAKMQGGFPVKIVERDN